MKRKTTVIALPNDLVKEIKAVKGTATLETFVLRAVRTQIATIRQREHHKKLKQDYAESADLYGELSTDVADEVWLRLRKDSLLCAKKFGYPPIFSSN